MKASMQLVPSPVGEVAAADYPTSQAGDSDEWSPDAWLQKSTQAKKVSFKCSSDGPDCLAQMDASVFP